MRSLLPPRPAAAASATGVPPCVRAGRARAQPRSAQCRVPLPRSSRRRACAQAVFSGSPSVPLLQPVPSGFHRGALPHAAASPHQPVSAAHATSSPVASYIPFGAPAAQSSSMLLPASGGSSAGGAAQADSAAGPACDPSSASSSPREVALLNAALQRARREHAAAGRLLESSPLARFVGMLAAVVLSLALAAAFAVIAIRAALQPYFWEPWSVAVAPPSAVVTAAGAASAAVAGAAALFAPEPASSAVVAPEQKAWAGRVRSIASHRSSVLHRALSY